MISLMSSSPRGVEDFSAAFGGVYLIQLHATFLKLLFIHSFALYLMPEWDDGLDVYRFLFLCV